LLAGFCGVATLLTSELFLLWLSVLIFARFLLGRFLLAGLLIDLLGLLL
jgi:uncharacterized membrane protein YdcZ (DUF606 family)